MLNIFYTLTPEVQCALTLPTGVQVSVGSKSTYEFMDEVTLGCKIGYQVSGGNASGECLATGTWKGGNLTCSSKY